MVKNLPIVWETRLDPWVRKIPWRREWLYTPIFLPGEFNRQRSLVGYSPWGHKESDTTEQLRLSLSFHKKPTFRPMASNDLPEVCVRGGYGPQVYLLTQQTLSTHSFD